ncbi:hypothetical protein EF903_17960 [Streptomyces sp. WAC05292]|uniref:hypothetical protein n=1 Tax=Streptomyces sp. WAC05292 TaxID=2487418 RepID=UPI000F74543A|nr:hypothetical protein [Streptomyces sp. WAC05292]RSS86997.1 hypothetical protein EF903_17960 [Streptomyces sp. WAC05292]
MHTPRPAVRLTAGIVAALAVFTALLALALVSDADGHPACPTSRSGALDIVPAGVRPCVLYGRSPAAVAPEGGTAPGAAPRLNTTNDRKQPTAPKAPVAPKTLAPPKAPAPAAPRPPAPAVKVR